MDQYNELDSILLIPNINQQIKNYVKNRRSLVLVEDFRLDRLRLELKDSKFKQQKGKCALIEITPWQNGIHSLAKGLEAFDNLKTKADPYILKDSILSTHHGIETVFKAILSNKNPVLILDKSNNMDKIINSFKIYFDPNENEEHLIYDKKTIGLLDTLKRLKDLGFLKFLDEKKYHQFESSVSELIKVRNNIQHLGLRADVEVVSRILGNVIPRTSDILETLAPGFNTNLKQLYNEAPNTIEYLRENYDDLLRKAITYFTKNTFKDLDLHIRVKDHGKVGAPPYLPELDLKGFINLELDSAVIHKFSQQNNIVDYNGSIEVFNPKKISSVNEVEVEGAMILRATIDLRDAENVFKLSDQQEMTNFLRNINVSLNVEINYKAEALYNDSHYHINNLIEVTGQLTLEISSVPKGYSKVNQEYQIFGTYTADLNKENSPFSFHSFVSPDKTLKPNHSLEWNIQSNSNLKFK